MGRSDARGLSFEVPSRLSQARQREKHDLKTNGQRAGRVGAQSGNIFQQSAKICDTLIMPLPMTGNQETKNTHDAIAHDPPSSFFSLLPPTEHSEFK